MEGLWGCEEPSQSPGDGDRNSKSLVSAVQRGDVPVGIGTGDTGRGIHDPESGGRVSLKRRKIKIPCLLSPAPLLLLPSNWSLIFLSLLPSGSQVKSLKCLEGWNSYFTFHTSGEGALGARVPSGRPVTGRRALSRHRSQPGPCFAPLGSGREQKRQSRSMEPAPALTFALLSALHSQPHEDAGCSAPIPAPSWLHVLLPRR